jgi:hypothetical protein
MTITPTTTTVTASVEYAPVTTEAALREALSAVRLSISGTPSLIDRGCGIWMITVTGCPIPIHEFIRGGLFDGETGTEVSKTY